MYTDCDWKKALDDAAKLLLLGQYDLDATGYFADVTSANASTYIKNGVTYDSINPSDDTLQPTYVFDTIAVANVFSIPDPNGSTPLIGLLDPSSPLLQRKLGSNTIDLRSKVEGVIRLLADADNATLIYPEVDKLIRNDLTIQDLSVPITSYTSDGRCSYIQGFDVVVWQHDHYGTFIDGSVNPVADVLLQLNNQDRQGRRPSSWYDTVVPYMCHSSTPKVGVNVFSFALNLEGFQPDGSCNFSRIDTAILSLTRIDTSKYADYADVVNSRCKLYVYAVNYNILRIMSGMGGLAYAN